MPGPQPDTDSGRISALPAVFDPEELRRRNLSSAAIDVLYLFTTAFLAVVFVRGFWPAVIAAAPLSAMLYFAWRSTAAFFLAQLLAIVLAVGAAAAGLLPF